MRKLPIVLLIISLVMNGLLIWFFVFRGEVIEIKNQRKAVLMTKENREVVLGEMRDFLSNIQQINEGLLENNPEKIIQAARASGRDVEETVPQGLIKSLPMDFKKLGFATHDLFDEIADSAQINFNPTTIRKQLNRTLNNCVACHQVYQIKVKE